MPKTQKVPKTWKVLKVPKISEADFQSLMLKFFYLVAVDFAAVLWNGGDGSAVLQEFLTSVV